MSGIIQFNTHDCKNCYKCIRFCPVKAIEVKNHCAQIIENDCLLCGNCTIICPQHAKEDIEQIPEISNALSTGKKLIASVAPSFAAYFSTDFATLREALQELGFYDAFETAEGAHLVKSEYERIVHENPGKVYISSCCSVINSYIRKKKTKAQQYLLPVLTPIQAHAQLLKQRFPDAEVVFIAPCIAKKGEQQEPESVFDYTLIFDELKEWFQQVDIQLEERVERNTTDPKLSRLFPKTGGVLQTMRRETGWRYLTVDGFENCALAIDDVISGRMKDCFLEMNFCSGGCVGAPAFRKDNLSLAYSELKVRNSANTRDFAVDFEVPESVELSKGFHAKRVRRMAPSEAQITAVLRQIGKNSPEDELNCGMCGYPTCREKARAVLEGKAEITMCLPFMRERAESFANKVIDILPAALLSVDMDLKIQQMNRSAREIFHLEEDVIGQPISRLMDEYDFVHLIASGEEQTHKRAYLPEYNLYLDESLQFDKSNGIIVVTMQDITTEKKKSQQATQAKIQAAAMADEIVDKQLRTVHEIAFLLGETAAETKSAINDLKNTILLEEEGK